MGDILLRNVAPDVDRKLRDSAARNKRSISEEAQVLLRQAFRLPPAEPLSLLDAIRAGLQADDFAELEIPLRNGGRPPPDLS